MSNYSQAKDWLTKAVNADCKTEAVITCSIYGYYFIIFVEKLYLRKLFNII